MGPLWLAGVCQLAAQFASTPAPASVRGPSSSPPEEEGHVLQAHVLSRENTEPGKILQVPSWVLWSLSRWQGGIPTTGAISGCRVVVASLLSPALRPSSRQFMARAPSPWFSSPELRIKLRAFLGAVLRAGHKVAPESGK